MEWIDLKIGIVKEVKNNENRVALPPAGAYELIQFGHEVYVESDAGKGSAITNEAYEQVGATIVDRAQDAWNCDLVLKVKEPMESEYKYRTIIRSPGMPDVLLGSYFHQ